MNSDSQPGSSAGEKPGAGDELMPQQLRILPGHAGFTLIGTAFLLFECGFLLLYTNEFWFSYDISYLGVPAVLLALLLAHFLLTWIESPSGCAFFEPLKAGLPLLPYRLWIRLDQNGFSFGKRQVLWSAVDELELTIWGNLLVKSRAVCGSAPAKPDLLFKIPFACAAVADQVAFINRLREKRAQVILHPRLLKCLSAPHIAAAGYIQLLGAVFMLVVLLDVGQATFGFLQMSKQYYLAQVSARANNSTEAGKYLQQADSLRQHPWLPYSWVNDKLLTQGTVAAGVAQARSEALWYLQRPDEAIKEAQLACRLHPGGFRYNLRLARLLAASGDEKAARQQIRQAIAGHENSLLPRLYMVAILTGVNRSQAQRFYDNYLADLKEQVFGDEPWWPPGGNRFLSEMFFQEDTAFVFDRLIKGLSPSAHLR